ncbi:MAG: hypothetical protein PF518_08550 [Spirochaetaceae bacterium]|jgi:hypothetical protein|nr:hypothetical protein [Spirochaetaceae bacterium]
MKLLFILIPVLFFSCSDISNKGNSLFNMDLRPPVLKSVEIENSRSLSIFFDEPVSFNPADYISDPGLEIETWNISETSITLHFKENQTPGKLYICRSDVSDESGNTLSFIIRYYGWNPNIPELLINEFNPEGSGNNPDTIELFVLTDGNVAGASIFIGSKNEYRDYYILPDLNVLAGDYIIIHMRPEGLSGEINETTDKAVSTGKLYSDSAWDLWVDGDKPLSGKNGAISLYTNPFGKMIDVVVYSNRLSADSEDYLGWTSTTIKMIEELSFMNEWNNTDGFIRPEDAVNSDGTTGTRSICRNSISFDNNSRENWHIVPTGEKSFGIANSDNIYEP